MLPLLPRCIVAIYCVLLILERIVAMVDSSKRFQGEQEDDDLCSPNLLRVRLIGQKLRTPGLEKQITAGPLNTSLHLMIGL